MIAHHAAGRIAHQRCSVQANDGAAILAKKCHFPPLEHGLGVDLLPKQTALFCIGQQIGERTREEFFLRIVSQHAHQSGIGIQNAVVRRDDVYAFLERLEKLGETRFILA